MLWTINLLLTLLSIEVLTEKRPLQEKTPSLYPLYLQYWTQHRILDSVQRVLEECCFYFAKTFLPSVLQKKGWDCPPAAELTSWMETFRIEKTSFNHITTTDLDTEEMRKLFTSISSFRNVVVHRRRIPAGDVSQLLESAVKFAQILKDDLRAGKIEKLRSEVTIWIKNIEDTLQQKQEELGERVENLVQGVFGGDMGGSSVCGEGEMGKKEAVIGEEGEEGEEKQ